MLSPTVFPPNVQSGKSNSDKSDSSEEPKSSVAEENSETDNGSQDDMNTKPKVSAIASVALLNAAAKEVTRTRATALNHRCLRHWKTPATTGS